jgi:hypothetical protein
MHDYETDALSSTDLHLVSDVDNSCWHPDDESEDDSNSFDESEDYSEPYDETIAQPSGLVCSGKWPYPSDVFSFHEMSSVSSSDSNCASSSSSEPSLRENNGLPVASVFFEVTEDDRD